MERCPSHCEQCAQHSLLQNRLQRLQRTISRYITKKTKKWSYIQKRECKFLSHQATSRKKQKRSYTYSETRMQTSAAKPGKAFFWNFFGIHQDWNSKKIKHFAAKFFCKFFLHFFFGIHQDLVRICFFLEILPDEATCFAILPPYILMCMN